VTRKSARCSLDPDLGNPYPKRKRKVKICSETSDPSQARTTCRIVPTPEGPEGAIICAREAVPKATV
jgi:hypothetical protein